MTMVDIDGLSSQEAARRLAEHGLNEVSEPKISLARRIFQHFWQPVPWMLEAAIALQIGIGERVEASVIAALLVFNVILSFFQEGRAQAALAVLKSKLAVNATVKRDGAWREISAVVLAPGDLVKLEIGGVVPADARIVEGSVLLDLSMLTGESVPAEIGAGELAYAGAMAQRGAAIAQVTATGLRTYFGKTAELVSVARARSGEQTAVLGVVRNLAVFNGAVIVLLIAYAHSLAMPSGHIVALVLTAVLATIPVALPATFTLAAALGAQALTKKGVLLTRLSAVHEAATVDVLCADKTGTLTRNELKVAAVKPLREEFSDTDVLELAAIASSTEGFDPVDAAVRAAAPAASVTKPRPCVQRFTPFDPATKIAEAIICDEAGLERRVIKGAPAAVARATPFDARANAEIEALSHAGSRVLAVASGPQGGEVLVGLIALSDPPRSDSKALVAELASIGVSTIMITGDAEATAASVARAIGVKGPVCAAAKIPADVDPQDFGVYAGVFPQDKFRLVKAFQRKGHTVGMCGDGANDAPALRQAQMGVAVSTATDIAKSAASLVLTEPGLRGVVTAIEEGRTAFQRILTYTLNALVKKFLLVPFLGAGLLITGHAIMTPLQMALLLITGDFLTMSIATDRATPSATPDSWNLRAITGAAAALGLFGLMFLIGVILVGGRIGALDLDRLRTLTFVALVFFSQATVYVVRDREHMWRSWPSAWLAGSSVLNLAIAVVVARFGLLMAPLPLWLIGAVFFATLLFSLALDGVKSTVFRIFGLVRPSRAAGAAPSPAEESAARRRSGMAALESLAAPAGALALLAFGAVAWRDWPPPAVGGAPNYLTETAVRGPIMRRLAIDGMVEASAQTPVVARVSGTIASLACRNGMHVEAGMVCARLDARSYRRTLENQRAKLAAVKNREARREKLPARQQARLAQEATNLESSLAAASEALAHTDIVAPVGGTVVATNAKIRQRVEASDFAAPLFRLAEDAQDSAIAFDVPRNDLKSLRIDAPVALTWNAEPGRTFSGVIARIDSRHSAAKEHADVIVFAQKSDGDPPAGAKVTGIVETTLRDNVLRAPLAALRFVPRLDAAPSRTDDEEPRLWVLRNGALTRVGVTLGVDDGRYVEIVRGGIEEGDQIVGGENNAKAP